MLAAIDGLEAARREGGYIESVICDDDAYNNEKFTNRYPRSPCGKKAACTAFSVLEFYSGCNLCTSSVMLLPPTDLHQTMR